MVLDKALEFRYFFNEKMRWTPLTHLTEELFSFSLVFFCDYVCLGKHFLIASSPDLMHASLTVITRANNAGTSHLSMFFPRKGDGKVEVSTRPSRGNGHCPTPIYTDREWHSGCWAEVFHASWKMDPGEKWIYLFNILRYKVEKPKNQNSFCLLSTNVPHK